MRILSAASLPLALAAMTALSCSKPRELSVEPRELSVEPRELSVEPLESPASAGSAEPDLAVDSAGKALFTWIDTNSEGSRALRFSRREAEAWSAPVTIYQGADLLANWADTPRVGADSTDRVAVSWPRLQGGASEGYDVVVQLSSDEGRTWEAPRSPHRDGTATEHDFPSLHSDPSGGLGIVWLDGRATSDGNGAQALMAATIASDGTLGPERVIDPRVCDCCATASARSGDTVIVVYRDRSETEVRDIAVSRLVAGEWSEGVSVAADGWTIQGCPVNGPALAASGSSIALAWFTEPESGARVNVAFSADAGATFGAPLRVDDGKPLGRVDVVILSDGSALVGWIERAGAAETASAEFKVRVVDPKGVILGSASVAPVEPGRAGGFPRLISAGRPLGSEVFAAWTSKDGDTTRVQAARLRWH